MADYRLTDQADADLEVIIIYTTETFGVAQAQRYKAALETGLQRIAADPRLGAKVEGRLRPYFRCTCEKHVFFFSKQADHILIVRILHTSMDFVRHLPEK